MTTYTNENLKNLTVPTIKEIAKGFKITLSSNGKRLTKPELISAILEVQPQAKTESKINLVKPINLAKKNIVSKVNLVKPRNIQKVNLVKQVAVKLNTSKIESLIAQARKLIKSAKNSQEKKQASNAIQSAITDLKLQQQREKKNNIQNKKIGKSIMMLNCISKNVCL